MATTTTAANTVKDDLLNIYRNNLIPMSIKGGSSISQSEIIDIISEYTWNANSLSTVSSSDTSISFSHNIPMCYAIERQQTVNSNIANVINTLNAAITAGAETARTLANATDAAATNTKNLINNFNTTKDTVQTGEVQTPPLATPDVRLGQISGSSGPIGEQPASHDSGSVAETVADAATKGADYVANAAQWVATKTESLQRIYNDLLNKWDRKKESNLNSDFLSPYGFLYFTKATGKKFVFPLLSSTDLLSVTNSYTDASTAEIPFIGAIDEFLKQAIGTMAGLTNFLNLFQDGSTVTTEQQHLEMAKAFNFNGDGQEITSNFVLFNTVKKDAWKKHYRFLVAFLLRNLPFKVSPYSFIPPLLYDIIIPGTKHLPLCYVSGITVQSLGKIRNLTIEDFVKGAVSGTTSSGTMLVPVPEAWNVTIKFKCLISNTANLILDLKNSPITISSRSLNG